MDEVEVLRKEVARLNTELQNAQRISTQYLQNVAHQLTAPLGAIKWSIEALKDEAVPFSRKKTLLSSVYSQATILVHLIKNFSLMSNLEADHELGQFREQPEPVDPMLLSINLVNDFQPQAYDQGIKIRVDKNSFRQTFGTKDILIEKNLVSQAICNILENAVKYADRDTEINISACATSEDIGVEVESTGIPIAATDRDSVFQRSFRGESARQKVAAGTGFGLYLASRVLAFHKGHIDLQTHGRVSKFQLMFPRARLAGEKGHA